MWSLLRGGLFTREFVRVAALAIYMARGEERGAGGGRGTDNVLNYSVTIKRLWGAVDYIYMSVFVWHDERKSNSTIVLPQQLANCQESTAHLQCYTRCDRKP